MDLVELRLNLFMRTYVYVKRMWCIEDRSDFVHSREWKSWDFTAVTCLPGTKMANSDSLLACGFKKPVHQANLDQIFYFISPIRGMSSPRVTQRRTERAHSWRFPFLSLSSWTAVVWHLPSCQKPRNPTSKSRVRLVFPWQEVDASGNGERKILGVSWYRSKLFKVTAIDRATWTLFIPPESGDDFA
jgi:hypothetical protein